MLDIFVQQDIHCNVEWLLSLFLFTSRRVLISPRIPDFALAVHTTARRFVFSCRASHPLCNSTFQKILDRLSRGKTAGTKVHRLYVSRRVASRSHCRRRGGAAAFRNYSESMATQGSCISSKLYVLSVMQLRAKHQIILVLAA